jgi:flagellar basal-body rod protein FlgF
MIYGLYESASGVIASSYRQDVIANNLANSQTTGFKRDIAMFKQRLTETQEAGISVDHSDPLQEQIGGGFFASPTGVDVSQGELEPTGNSLDVAVQGQGYFAVADAKGTRLTRDGQFNIGPGGRLSMANDKGQPVLDQAGKPIILSASAQVSIYPDGTILQNGSKVAKLGLFDVTDPSQLSKDGGNLFKPADPTKLVAATGVARPGFVERANVDPTTELTDLMETQRELEANANMIHYQDSTLQLLCNSVGKIS